MFVVIEGDVYVYVFSSMVGKGYRVNTLLQPPDAALFRWKAVSRLLSPRSTRPATGRPPAFHIPTDGGTSIDQFFLFRFRFFPPLEEVGFTRRELWSRDSVQ